MNWWIVFELGEHFWNSLMFLEKKYDEHFWIVMNIIFSLMNNFLNWWTIFEFGEYFLSVMNKKCSQLKKWSSDEKEIEKENEKQIWKQEKKNERCKKKRKNEMEKETKEKEKKIEEGSCVGRPNSLIEHDGGACLIHTRRPTRGIGIPHP